MNIKKVILYLLGILAFILWLIFSSEIFKGINTQINEGRDNSIFVSFFMIPMVIYGTYGAILHMPNLYLETKKNGKWKIDFYRLFIFGIPLLLISLYPVVVPLVLKFISIYIHREIMDIIVQGMCKVAFGFVLASSFYKEE